MVADEIGQPPHQSSNANPSLPEEARPVVVMLVARIAKTMSDARSRQLKGVVATASFVDEMLVASGPGR